MTERNADEYYDARERRERALAAKASDPAIAAIHQYLADRYAELSVPSRAAGANGAGAH